MRFFYLKFFPIFLANNKTIIETFFMSITVDNYCCISEIPPHKPRNIYEINTKTR